MGAREPLHWFRLSLPAPLCSALHTVPFSTHPSGGLALALLGCWSANGRALAALPQFGWPRCAKVVPDSDAGLPAPVFAGAEERASECDVGRTFSLRSFWFASGTMVDGDAVLSARHRS